MHRKGQRYCLMKNKTNLFDQFSNRNDRKINDTFYVTESVSIFCLSEKSIYDAVSFAHPFTPFTICCHECVIAQAGDVGATQLYYAFTHQGINHFIRNQ